MQTTTTCETLHPPPQPAPMQSIMGGMKDSPNQKHGGWREKGRDGWINTKELLLPSLSSTFSLTSSFRQWAPAVLHTSPKTTTMTKLSRPATLDQQDKVGFFPFHGGEGKPRPKEGQVCPVPFSKAGFSGEELKSQKAWRPISSPSPRLQLLWLPARVLNDPRFWPFLMTQKTQMKYKQETFTCLI